MKRLLSLSIACALAVTPAFAKDKDKDKGNNRQPVAAQKVKSAARSTGHAVRSVAHNTREVASNAGGKVRNVARDTRVVASNVGSNVRSVARESGQRTNYYANRAVRAVTPDQVATSRITTSNSRDYDRRDSDRNRDWSRDRDRDNRWDGDRHRSWSGYRYYHAPSNIYRSWDRGRIYSWNNHRYHWYGGNWVIIDPGYAYTGPYYSNDLPIVGSSVVSEVQHELQVRGYDPGPADGIAGSMTRNAIAQFQRDQGLLVTGNINQALLNSLNI